MENVIKKPDLDELKEYFDDARSSKYNRELEYLVESFESLNKRYYRISFFTKLLSLFLTLFQSYFVSLFFLAPETFFERKISIFTSSIIVILLSIGNVVSNNSTFSHYRKGVKMLEEEIIRTSLDFDRKNEGNSVDFFIKLNNFTKSGYEVYYKSVFYEYIIYAVIISSLSLFLIFKTF